jgi:hypothetical protein
MFSAASMLESRMNNKNCWESPGHDIVINVLDGTINIQKVEVTKILRHDIYVL